MWHSAMMKPFFRKQSVPTRLVPETQPGDCVYAIGDIHGRADLLVDLLHRIEAHAATLPADRDVHLIFLGDLIDRGPEAAKVLRMVKEIEERSGTVIVLAGNHEEFMLRALDGQPGAMRAWLRSGGDATLRSLGVEPPARGDDPSDTCEAVRAALTPAVLEWVRSRPLTARSGDYFFCHAGIRPGRDLKRQSRADLLWIRDEFLEDDGDHGVIVVHGHSISDEVEIRSNRIGVDTGAYRSGVLTAIYLDGPLREIIAATRSDPPQATS